MQLIIDIPEETFKYYAILANKGEQIGNLERIILDGTPLKGGSEDCIRREEAIGIVARIKEMHIDDKEQYPINYGTICDIDLALQQLPTVTPHQTRWIPVSERLPEEEGWYLVTDASGGLRMTEHSFYMPQEDKMEEPYWDYMNVVAWMPLPEPYTESEE